MDIVITAPGTEVLLGPDKAIVGRIDKVQICAGLVPRYFISWWDGRTLNTSDFDACEFKPVAANTLHICFK
mgnify:CR=1 FL=1